ncbi:hypothetical protein LX87_01011 [Larkinella arboricola]|uniref:Uncharacterized protein n=1 Tax=Larkinella arboricola TaxID=643671 RepID=A0A327X6X6_LARAB|nr:hypothetical protein LX87_01011 [Larkinella arboricola]
MVIYGNSRWKHAGIGSRLLVSIKAYLPISRNGGDNAIRSNFSNAVITIIDN